MKNKPMNPGQKPPKAKRFPIFGEGNFANLPDKPIYAKYDKISYRAGVINCFDYENPKIPNPEENASDDYA